MIKNMFLPMIFIVIAGFHSLLGMTTEPAVAANDEETNDCYICFTAVDDQNPAATLNIYTCGCIYRIKIHQSCVKQVYDNIIESAFERTHLLVCPICQASVTQHLKDQALVKFQEKLKNAVYRDDEAFINNYLYPHKDAPALPHKIITIGNMLLEYAIENHKENMTAIIIAILKREPRIPSISIEPASLETPLLNNTQDSLLYERRDAGLHFSNRTIRFQRMPTQRTQHSCCWQCFLGCCCFPSDSD